MQVRIVGIAEAGQAAEETALCNLMVGLTNYRSTTGREVVTVQNHVDVNGEDEVLAEEEVLAEQDANRQEVEDDEPLEEQVQPVDVYNKRSI